ncbi:hypothetical protein LLEC1_06013 [Akanthomyces lecanii]|uniref:Chromatin remodeling factor mit1 n=1 Tax=Cordyceps confragosa TaxID=2714763 RepID=A0A179INH7_CORDF|nr:hypothetical protein LLEC1_06013 [Akanthomyces lecanii]
MNDLDGLEGLGGAFDAFDWVTRDGAFHDATAGVALEDISMDDDFLHGDDQIAIDADDAEQEPVGDKICQAQSGDAQSRGVEADADDAEEGAVPDKNDQGPIVEEQSEIEPWDSHTGDVTADPAALEGAALEIVEQERFADDSDPELAADAQNQAIGSSLVEIDSPNEEPRREEDEAMLAEGQRAESHDYGDSSAVFPAGALRLEVELRVLPESLAEDYSVVLSEAVEHVCGEVASGDSYHVEFTDGRVETITRDHLLRLRNGESALDGFLDPFNMSDNPRKRKHGGNDWDYDFESESGELQSDAMEVDGDESDEPVKQFIRRSTRRASQKPRIVITRRQEYGQSDDEFDQPPRQFRSLRPRASNPSYYGAEPERDAPEARYKGADDDDFMPVISDLAPPKRGRRPTRGRGKSIPTRRRQSGGGGSDIEFEPLRRSSRATKNVQGMNDEFDSDDDFESMAVVKERGAPKVVSVREIFQPVEPDSPFAVPHMQKCYKCSGSKQRGQLIYCQGCSLTFHRPCIGLRSAREHMVTKVDEDSFVLQCNFCIGVYTSRDETAPKYDMCQQCGTPGLSCSAFSPKRTARQEEKMREENNGIDPVASVTRELINNSENVLFRCLSCHRGWHQNHLPSREGVQSDVASYSQKWRCSECLGMAHKIHRLVAWRPTKPYVPTKGQRPPYWQDTPDDEKEYLVKWEAKSYAHCTWLPGAWVYGIAAPSSRKAFGKRDVEQSLLHMTEKDAIPEEFLAPDIILVAKMDSAAPAHRSKEDMLGNISHVRRIYVKFQGLGYEDVVWDTPPTPDLTALYPAYVEAYGEYVNGRYFEQEMPTTIRHRVEEFKHEAFTELDAQPKGIRRGKLMGYQLEGLNWLLGNYHHSRSVVLADEMGLGKTVQVVSLVTSLVQDSPKCWPFLIVVPNATCPNWRREFRQWAPDLRVVAYHGGRESQELTYRYELFPEHGGGMRAHAVIMSYDSAQDPKTAGLFKAVKWAGLVVDEGQRLKNDQNLLYQALRGMKIPFRLLLTGTPLQNNKRELFNLIQFIDTTQDAAKLDEEFEVLDKETLPRLHEKIRPYFLRRTKAGVLKFLPPMAQIIVPVTMTVVQEKLAKSIMSKNPELIKAIFADSKLKRTDRGSLNNILMQLRKCLCHPFMYSENIEERHHDPTAMFRNLVEASAKLLLLEIMLPKLKERGHRVLIFSQFLQQLDIIEDFLIGIGCEYKRLDGGMSSLEKQKRIDAFNEPDSPLFAFLLSTRAGGVGINLATADTVIIMDPDFNPHQDLQAISRAHRIGQKNKVLCFQFMTKDSVEERIVQVGRSKMALDHALIESMDDDELEGADLESILKHGASALFNDNYQKTKIEYTSATVESLLDRSQMEQAKVEAENPSAEAPFAYARVWDSEKVGFESLPTAEAEAPVPLSAGVWDKIIAQREEEARRKAEANREVLGRGGRRRTKIDYTAKADVQKEDAEKGASSDSDEFSKGDSSSESDEDPALTKEEQEAGHRELAEQTKTTQRPAQVEHIQITSIPSRHKGPIKEKFARVPHGAVGAQPGGKLQQGTNAASGQAGQQHKRAGHPPSVKKRVTVALPAPAPAQTSLVPNEFWHYVSRLASEVEVRMAIDEVARNKEQRAPREQHVGYHMNRIWNDQHSSQSSPGDTASLSSRGSTQQDGVGSSTTASQHTSSSSRASVGSTLESLPAGAGLLSYAFDANSAAYCYYLDRGNGQFTRLIPADMLPPMKGVPGREEEHDGMVILQPLEKLHLQNTKEHHRVSTPKNQIDCIVATSPKSSRKIKIYCDKWIHEGVCAFTQQGCKFKHEMPQDEATQRSLGLFHGYPAWWKKRTEEQNSPRRGLGTGSQSTSPSRMRPATPHLGNGEASRGRSHHPAVFEHQRGLPPRDHSYGQTGFASGPGSWKPSGSQWMQNGIVPFVRGPRRAY